MDSAGSFDIYSYEDPGMQAGGKSDERVEKEESYNLYEDVCPALEGEKSVSEHVANTELQQQPVQKHQMLPYREEQTVPAQHQNYLDPQRWHALERQSSMPHGQEELGQPEAKYPIMQGPGPVLPADGNEDQSQQQFETEPLEKQVVHRAVYVGNLTWWTTDQDLEEVFLPFGKLCPIRFFEDKVNGKSKGLCLEGNETIAGSTTQRQEYYDQLRFCFKRMHSVAAKGTRPIPPVPFPGIPMQPGFMPPQFGSRGGNKFGVQRGRGGRFAPGRGYAPMPFPMGFAPAHFNPMFMRSPPGADQEERSDYSGDKQTERSSGRARTFERDSSDSDDGYTRKDRRRERELPDTNSRRERRRRRS